MSRVIWTQNKCRRCGGDLLIDPEEEHPVEKCLQCSYEKILVPVSITKEVEDRSGKEASRDRKSHHKKKETEIAV